MDNMSKSVMPLGEMGNRLCARGKYFCWICFWWVAI